MASGGVVTDTAASVPSLGIDLAFRLDGFSLLFALLITGIGSLVTIYATSYFSEADARERARFVFLIHLFMTAMLGTVLSDNLIVMCPSSKHLAQVWRGVNGERASSGVGF